MKRYGIIIAIASISLLQAAPRPGVRKQSGQTMGQQKVVMIPVSVNLQPQKLNDDDQQDRDLLMTCLSIASNIGMIFLDPKNPHLVTNSIGNVINSIFQAHEIVSRYQNRGGDMRDLRRLLAQVIRSQIGPVARRVQYAR